MDWMARKGREWNKGGAGLDQEENEWNVRIGELEGEGEGKGKMGPGMEVQERDQEKKRVDGQGWIARKGRG